MKVKAGLTSLNLTKEERAEYDDQAKDALHRLQKRYEESQKNQG